MQFRNLWHYFIANFISLSHDTTAQDHLIRDSAISISPKSYQTKVTEMFSQAFVRSVRLNAIILMPFKKEIAVGLNEKDGTFEAFVLVPSSPIWDVEVVRLYETGEIRLFRNGKFVPLAENETYKKLKKTTPNDFRAITTVRHTRPLPKKTADAIMQLWEIMLLSANPKEGAEGVEDAGLYCFYAQTERKGRLSAHLVGPNDPESKAGRFTAFAAMLRDFVDGKVGLGKLNTQLEKAIKP